MRCIHELDLAARLITYRRDLASLKRELCKAGLESIVERLLDRSRLLHGKVEVVPTAVPNGAIPHELFDIYVIICRPNRLRNISRPWGDIAGSRWLRPRAID
ncbi:hypothetical protein D3C80_1515300 [compost metagenome]